jgi:hypothetical protein
MAREGGEQEREHGVNPFPNQSRGRRRDVVEETIPPRMLFSMIVNALMDDVSPS